jgi:hypothetical protein
MPDRSRTLLVVHDGLEQGMLTALMKRGCMPCLRSMIECGARGEITPAAPFLPHSLLATLFTGAPLHVHGVGLSTSKGARVPCVWDSAHATGLRTLCVGLPAEVNPGDSTGLNISAQQLLGAVTPMPEDMRDLCVRPDALEPRLVRLFCPALDPGAAEDPRLHQLFAALALQYSTRPLATKFRCPMPPVCATPGLSKAL